MAFRSVPVSSCKEDEFLEKCQLKRGNGKEPLTSALLNYRKTGTRYCQHYSGACWLHLFEASITKRLFCPFHISQPLWAKRLHICSSTDGAQGRSETLKRDTVKVALLLADMFRLWCAEDVGRPVCTAVGKVGCINIVGYVFCQVESYKRIMRAIIAHWQLMLSYLSTTYNQLTTKITYSRLLTNNIDFSITLNSEICRRNGYEFGCTRQTVPKMESKLPLSLKRIV